MARRRTHGHGREQHGDEQLPNGAADPSDTQQTNGQEGNQAPGPTMQRAEELVDRLADRLSHYAGVVGHKLAWLAARAREEAEDIWAEAQALRRGEHQ
jgi:hypothetical protein